jgi:GTP-binding protein
LKLSKRPSKKLGRNPRKADPSKQTSSPKSRKAGSPKSKKGGQPGPSKASGYARSKPGSRPRPGNEPDSIASPPAPLKRRGPVSVNEAPERHRAQRIDYDETPAPTSPLDPGPKSKRATARSKAEEAAATPPKPAAKHADPLTGAPLFAICGRPNVGKSTLFNKLTESRRSIVGDEPGITRDRIYGEVHWDGHIARIVDTGGMVPDDEALIPSEIYRQASFALDEADCIVMVVDGRTELASPDYDLAKQLLRSGKSIILAVNKIDTPQMAAAAENYRRLGFKTIVPVSAEHSIGIGDLLDEVFSRLKFPDSATIQTTTDEEESKAYQSEIADDLDGDLDTDLADELDDELEEDAEEKETTGLHRTHGEFELHETKVAIIGRPNVGKSTLLNALTGTSRAIVSPIAGTTRDAVDEVIDYEGDRLRIIDTAGIRRKGKTTQMAEKLSVVMAIRHLEAADVALLMIDAVEGVTAADATIGGYAHESGRSVIIVVNKWDLITSARTDGKPPADRSVYEEQLRGALKYLSYAPVVFISASKGNNLARVLQLIKEVAAARRKRVTTGQMNRFLERVDFQRASVPMAKKLRIYYMTQAAVAPPTFVLFANRAIKLHFSFERFLENQIREHFGFEGTPIWFKVKARNEKGN